MHPSPCSHHPPVLEIDTLGTFNMSKAALPALSTAPHAHACVINISATMQYGAAWYQSHAAAAKSAIDSLTRSLALEWGEFGIRVVSVAPGPISDTTGRLHGGALRAHACATFFGSMSSVCIYFSSYLFWVVVWLACW